MKWLDKFNSWRLRRARLRSYQKALRSPRFLNDKFNQRYAAARPSRLESSAGLMGWMNDFNSLVASANPVLRERVRSLVRNFPPFQRAIAAQSAYVVGKGARFQSLVVDSAGEPDKQTRQKIESRFRAWMEKASIDGRLHFYECQRLALRQKLECGEFFFAFRKPKNNNRHPLALQFIEPDRVSGGLDVRPGHNDALVWQGVEFDPETGERFAYHVLKEQFPGAYDWGYDRVHDERMVHGYQLLRPGQLRGVTIFAPAIILADSMADYMESELDAAKMAAKWLAFVTSNDPLDFQGKRFGQNAAADAKLEDLENCAIEYLKVGEQIQIAPSSGRVGDGFDRFTKFVLRMISIVAGTPYEILSGDYSGINYSTARMSRQDFNMFLEPDRFWLEYGVNRPVFREWLRWEALTQDYLPGYFQNPAHYEAAMWVPAGMPSPDPLREGKADIDNIKAALISPQQIILNRGEDPERVQSQILAWKAWCGRHGIPFMAENISTALQTNPAKLEELGDNDLSYFEEEE